MLKRDVYRQLSPEDRRTFMRWTIGNALALVLVAGSLVAMAFLGSGGKGSQQSMAKSQSTSESRSQSTAESLNQGDATTMHAHVQAG